MSNNASKLKNALENAGKTGVRVWWEPLSQGNEMCGPAGGWFYEANGTDVEPLGYNFGEAMTKAKTGREG